MLTVLAAAGVLTTGAHRAPQWELAELAGRCVGDAHGLDDGRLTATVVLRAAAAACGVPVPETAAARRDLWARIGVIPDLLSGTVLVWGLRPPGDDPWSRMMRDRADLGLVTHLTLHELNGAAGGVPLADTDVSVFSCENPQVVQAAARMGAVSPLICLAGNPSSAGWITLRRLVEAGAAVRYHGDFDWPGIAIAGRVLAAGVAPWRMSVADYLQALEELPRDAAPELTGTPVVTPWEPGLAAVMQSRNVAVHEEATLPLLLAGLCSGETSPREASSRYGGDLNL